jgi:hypothetical protein
MFAEGVATSDSAIVERFLVRCGTRETRVKMFDARGATQAQAL